MAKYGRGLICLTLNEDRVKKLGLSLMSLTNQSRHKTAFTISIEAREGITTGISAFDRAKTIKDAIDENKGSEAIVSPGHIFPLKAQNGGVLVRAGHTEASVDIAKLAGLIPSGVICEIMNDDGTMARMPDLVEFAKNHNLKIATIADLIEYRRKNEKLIELKDRSEFESISAGKFEMLTYINRLDGIEHIVLKKGEIKPDQANLVRMHHFKILSDVLDDKNNEKSGLLQRSLKIICENGNGVVVIIRNPQESLTEKKEEEQNKILRNYGVGAQILLDLGIKNLTLLTNSQKSIIGLDGYGIKISGYKPI
jgi:3,4-dihydroxy 2-butanone 4-phosphate synthase/GTP cyclohydrolase II